MTIYMDERQPCPYPRACCVLGCHGTCDALLATETERTGLPRRIVSALLGAGLVPPLRSTVDSVGFNARERAAIGVSPVEDWGS